MKTGMSDDIRLADNLKKISKSTSLRRLAKEAGVPQSSLSSWAHGQLPSGAAGHRNLRRLCTHLKCSVETIMFGDVTSEPPKLLLLNDLLNNGEVFSGRFVVDLKVKRLAEED